MNVFTAVQQNNYAILENYHVCGYVSLLLFCLLQGVELPKVDTSHEVEKNVRKREEEVRQLSGLLLSREAEEEDEEDLEKSYLRVKLEEAEDRRMWAEEEAEYRRMREEEEAEYRRMREEEEAEDKMREEEKVAEDRRMREEEEAAEDRRMRVEEEAAENRRMREEEEAEDRRMRAGEELKIMHSRLTDMANEKVHKCFQLLVLI